MILLPPVFSDFHVMKAIRRLPLPENLHTLLRPGIRAWRFEKNWIPPPTAGPMFYSKTG